MPISIILALISAVVPALVQEAESLFSSSGNGAQKRQWVLDGVHDLLQPLEKKVPSWAGTVIADLEPLIDQAINFALVKAGL